jgi:hypothetical protein
MVPQLRAPSRLNTNARVLGFRHKEDGTPHAKNALISAAIMSKNRGKSKLSKNVLLYANKHVFHCGKSLGTLFYGQPSLKKLYSTMEYAQFPSLAFASLTTRTSPEII